MARKAAPRQPGADRILDAALALAAAGRWREVTMERVAAEAGATLPRVLEFYPSRSAFVSALARRVDAAVLRAHDPADAGEPVRERLLDVLLRRFDALAPYKEALRSILRDAGGDPCALLCTGAGLLRSMAWSVEAAGLSAAGVAGAVRVKGLAAIYLSAMPVWFRDEGADLARTSAHIDRALRRADAVMARFRAPARSTENADNSVA